MPNDIAFQCQNCGVTSQAIFKLTEEVPSNFRQCDGIETQKRSKSLIAIGGMPCIGNRAEVSFRVFSAVRRTRAFLERKAL